MEIHEEHVEWATVNRMREMLPAENAEYKLTLCYALFTGILCWTMQRIRSRPDEGDGIGQVMNGLAADLQQLQFVDFVRLRLRRVAVAAGFDTADRGAMSFNDFSAFNTEFGPSNAFETLVGLRNAVAHGDARKVSPVNRNGLLIGYRLECNNRKGWQGSVVLDRDGLTRIATTLADTYCNVLSKSDELFEDEAKRIGEGV